MEHYTAFYYRKDAGYIVTRDLSKRSLEEAERSARYLQSTMGDDAEYWAVEPRKWTKTEIDEQIKNLLATHNNETDD